MPTSPRLPVSLSRHVAALLTIGFAQAATAGVQIEMERSVTTTTAGQTERHSSHYPVQIDGPRFRIVGQREVETSLDDGATTRFLSSSKPAQTPLVPDAPTMFDPIAATIEDEHVTIGPSVAGKPWNGHPTRRYSVDIDYTTVARLAFVIKRRLPVHDHYDITVADLDVSPAALRVSLTRGYGRSLALHREALAGFPVRIDFRTESLIDDKTRQGETVPRTINMTLEAKFMTPWDWTDSTK